MCNIAACAWLPLHLSLSPTLLCSVREGMDNKYSNYAQFIMCFDWLHRLISGWLIVVVVIKPHVTCVVFRPAPSSIDAMGEQCGEPPAAANTLLLGSQPQRHESVWRANR